MFVWKRSDTGLPLVGLYSLQTNLTSTFSDALSSSLSFTLFIFNLSCQIILKDYEKCDGTGSNKSNDIDD